MAWIETASGPIMELDGRLCLIWDYSQPKQVANTQKSRSKLESLGYLFDEPVQRGVVTYIVGTLQCKG